MPESKDESANNLDIPGAVLATFGLAGITYGFLEASEKGFSNPIIQLSLTGGFTALALFINAEKKSKHPMMPLNLFKSGTFSGVNVMTFFIYSALSASLFFLPLNLIQVQGYPEEIAGLTMLPFAIILAGFSRFSGAFSDKFGARIPLIIGPLISGVGLLVLSLPGITTGPEDYWTTYFPGIILLGIGMGIVVAPLTATIMASVPEHNSGIASGINNTMARTAGLLAIAVLGSLILISFKNNLETRIDKITIQEQEKQELLNNAKDLADTQPPKSLSDEKSQRVAGLIKSSFIESFDLIIYICVVLTWLGSFIAFFSVKKGILSGQDTK